jgi:hypothetical protein
MVIRSRQFLRQRGGTGLDSLATQEKAHSQLAQDSRLQIAARF